MVSKLNSYSDKELIRRWGEKLKRLRVDADFSQTELAVKTGMSRSSIAEIEKGRNFSIGSLISISRALNQLDKFENFLKEEEYELTPMEIYEREKKKRKRGKLNSIRMKLFLKKGHFQLQPKRQWKSLIMTEKPDVSQWD